MKGTTLKWTVAAVALLLVLGGAYLLYDRLLPGAKTPDAPDGGTLTGAPDVTVYDAGGQAVKLSDFRGRPVVLNFWGSWCHFCKKEMPDFDAAFNAHPDVQFLMVDSQESEQEGRAYVEKHGYSFPIYFDPEQNALSAYGVSGFPTTVFIDRDGKIAARANGMISADALEKGIEKITK